MAHTHQEGRLIFTFESHLAVFRPEDSAYYRRHFQSFCGGCKETDFAAWDGRDRTLWIIEVKDYANYSRAKSSDLFDEVAHKVRDTLALLAAAAASAAPDRAGTGAFARKCLPAKRLRVALHLELPARRGKLHPPLKFAADDTQKLRMKMRCVDPRALVVSSRLRAGAPWKVSVAQRSG